MSSSEKHGAALSARDHEALAQKDLKAPRGTGLLLALLRPVFRTPGIRQWAARTWGAAFGRVFRHWEAGAYRRAYDAAVEALDRKRARARKGVATMQHHGWWQMMRHAVDSARMLPAGPERGELLERARAGPPPFEGYDVAYSFVWFARWAHEAGDYGQAERWASVASAADETWGYPDFLCGWLALATGADGAQACLERAVDRDPRMLFQIANNDLCKTRPDVIAALKRRAVHAPDT